MPPPWGLGGVLLAPDGKVLKYFDDTIHPEDVEFLGVEIGNCRSQSVLEALAVLVRAKNFCIALPWLPAGFVFCLL